jgi:large subunit ribosomal protein L35
VRRSISSGSTPLRHPPSSFASARQDWGGGYSAKAVVTKGKRHYLPRLMPKAIARNKTRKSVSKRFKITGTGKVMRQHASRRHLLSSKSAKRKRHMAKSAEVDKTDTYRIKSNMPFG